MIKHRGIEIARNFKKLSRDKAIVAAPLPDRVLIPLLQHKGNIAEPIVKQGDRVQAGDLIGEAVGNLSARIHASISGVVGGISEVRLSNGELSQAVEIIRDKNVAVNDFSDTQDWKNLSSGELQDLIRNAGVVGLGGATFPTHIKLSCQNKIDTLVVNGAECEPYISCDFRTLSENYKAVLEGIEITCFILGIENVKLGLEEENYLELKELKKDCESRDIQVIKLPNSYPQGDEKLLIQNCTGRLVSPKQLPAEHGVLVLNVSTLKAIRDAVVCQKALIERVVTVSGSGIKNPANLLVKIGTPISDLLEVCGGLSEASQYVLVGGPMMGFALDNLKSPVTKGTLGVLALEKKLPEIPEKDLKCIRCSRCIDACAFGIQPQLLYSLIRKEKIQKAEKHFLFYCKECGACDYVCPAKIPLLSYFRQAKKIILQKKTAQ